MKTIRKKETRNTSARPRESIPQFSRVLAATDLSDLSNAAVAYAYASVQPGGIVRILHVERPFEFANPSHAPHALAARRLEQERERQLEACRADLRALIPPEAETRGIRSEIEVLREENPAMAIFGAAEAFGADLICMASHGRSGLSKVILGSVAQAVMSRSRIPLLVVRPQKE